MPIFCRNMIEGQPKEVITNRSSNRSFGLVMTAFFLLVGLSPLFMERQPRIWALVLAGFFAVVGLFFSDLLKPLNTLWFRFGLLLHRVVSPITLGVIFFFIMTPLGLILRIFSIDLLRLKLDPSLESYWTERKPPGPRPDSMGDPF